MNIHNQRLKIKREEHVRRLRGIFRLLKCTYTSGLSSSTCASINPKVFKDLTRAAGYLDISFKVEPYMYIDVSSGREREGTRITITGKVV